MIHISDAAHEYLKQLDSGAESLPVHTKLLPNYVVIHISSGPSRASSIVIHRQPPDYKITASNWQFKLSDLIDSESKK